MTLKTSRSNRAGASALGHQSSASLARRAPTAARPTVRELLDYAVDRFKRARLHFGHGTDNAWDEAAWLILHALRKPVTSLIDHIDHRVTSAQQARIHQLIERRISERIPVAYLTREAWLGQHRFYVDERVIVPRSFIAELLHEQLRPWVTHPRRIRKVLDMCTGSGCLAILAALQFPRAVVDAVDLSGPALQVARRNIRAYALRDRLNLMKSDLFQSVTAKQYDLIICNPPYVNAASMRRLPSEFRSEPAMALASGQDGLDTTRRILREAKDYLSSGGLLIVEIGHNRAALERAFPQIAFTWLNVSAGDGYVFLLTREQLPSAD